MRPFMSVCIGALVVASLRLAGQGVPPRVAGPVRLMNPRIPPLLETRWTEEQQALATTYSRDGGAGNDFRTFLNHPGLVKGVMPFLNYVSSQSTLAPRQRVLLILRTA